MRLSGFDWDVGNREKCRKPGVSIDEIEALLSGSPRVVPDVLHSASKERFIAIGRGLAGRAIFVAFTLRRRNDSLLIRPVSARYMQKKESDAYDQNSSEDDER